MTSEEDAREHCHPKPSPGDDAHQGCEAEDQEPRVRCEDAAGELQDGDGFAKGVAAFVDGEGPEDGENEWNEREPAHGFILDIVAADLPLEAGNEGVEEEGEKDDGYSD